MPEPREISRPPGDGKVERGVSQDQWVPVGAVPWFHHLHQPVAKDVRLEDTAVEEDGVWPLVGLQLTLQESGQMARDGGGTDIRQGHFLKARARGPAPAPVAPDRREEAREDCLPHIP